MHPPTGKSCSVLMHEAARFLRGAGFGSDVSCSSGLLSCTNKCPNKCSDVIRRCPGRDSAGVSACVPAVLPLAARKSWPCRASEAIAAHIRRGALADVGARVHENPDV